MVNARVPYGQVATQRLSGTTRSGRGTKQAVQDPRSATRIGDGAMARHSDGIGSQLAHRLLETLAADDTPSELLHIEERKSEFRESVSLQI